MIFGLKKMSSSIVLGVLLLHLVPAVDVVAQDSTGTVALDPLDSTYVQDSAEAAAARDRIEVIIRLDGSMEKVRRLVESLGGNVTREYRYLGSLLAEVPTRVLERLKSAAAVKQMFRNSPIQAPELVWPFGGREVAEAASPDALANINSNGSTPITDVVTYALANPGSYIINHDADNVRELHQAGLTGEGVIVAVVDSGLRPNFGHFDEGTTVIGCEDFVGDGNGCIDRNNDGHGTAVAGIIAAGAEFHFPPSNVFLQSVSIHAPDAALDRLPNPAPDTVAMIGSAPDAQIYALRVFGNLAASSTATILEAIDRIIELKTVELVDIRVANFSLGRRTIYAGLDDFDQEFEILLANGIVPIVSTGNAGPALLTTASPASAFSAIAVGAGSLVHQDRIVGDVGFFGAPGPGDTLRPFAPGQTAWFSSRGPHADGRQGPQVMSDGFGVYGAGLANQSGNVSLVNGSSFSAPNVAGIAALLWEDLDNHSVPSNDLSATRIRNAIVGSGSGAIIVGGETPDDQGNGWVDAAAALGNLAKSDETLPPPPSPGILVKDNIGKTLAGVGDITFLENLEPGDRQDVIYEVLAGDVGLRVSLTNISTGTMCQGPAPFFGNELQLAIHSAKTSTAGPSGQYYDLKPNEGFEHAFIGQSDLDGSNVSGVLPGACDIDGCSFDLPTPEPGLVRISVSGATTNGCDMSAHVEIPSFTPGPLPIPLLNTGTVLDLDTMFAGSIIVNSGDAEIAFELSWDSNWTHYVGNDLELLVFMPGYPAPLPLGLTLNAPEKFIINSEILTALLGAHPPVPLPTGTWTLYVQGFEVNEELGEFWELRATIDGVPQ